MKDFLVSATGRISHMKKSCCQLEASNYYYSIIVNPTLTPSSNKVDILYSVQLHQIEMLTLQYRFVIVAIPCQSNFYKRIMDAYHKMSRILSPMFHLLSTFQKENNMKPINIYTTQPVESSEKSLGIYLIAGGYGDFFRHVYLLQNFVQTKLDEHYRITIHYANKQYRAIHNLLFPACLYREIPSKLSIKENILVKPFSETINFLDIPLIHTERLYQISIFLLNYFDREIDNLRLHPGIDCKIRIAQIELIKKRYRKVIGLQIHTDSKNPPDRNYSITNAQILIDLCQQNGIGVCILTPYHGNLKNCHDLAHVPIHQLPAIIKMMDCVVTIDSCCGHIASLMNTPCIVLFNKVLSYSQSVIRGNWNLVSKNGSVNSISPDRIFQIILRILNHCIKLPDKPRIHYNILNDYNTDII